MSEAIEVLESVAQNCEDASQKRPERRVFPRFLCEGMAEVIVLGGALRFSGIVQDLSATGCRLTTAVVFTLERGTQVEVVLIVNRIQFRVAGGVRSTHKARGLGLEFMNVSARCKQYIEDLILELAAKAAKAEAETCGRI